MKMIRLTPSAMYHATNENLNSIVEGLKIEEKDTVLAVCGSGDQAFAILEKSPKKVIAVDINDNQLILGEFRANSVKYGLYERFFSYDLLEKFKELKEKGEEKEDCYYIIERNKYFSDKLDKIRENIRKIEFRKGDIFDSKFYCGINKVYLSNCNLDVEAGLEEYIEKLPSGIEIYVSDSDSALFFGLYDKTKLMKKRTSKARSYYKDINGNKYDWWPAVFKKP